MERSRLKMRCILVEELAKDAALARLLGNALAAIGVRSVLVLLKAVESGHPAGTLGTHVSKMAY